mgnify:CR=1 FL=1
MSKEIEDLKKRISGQKVLLKKYEKMKNERLVKKVKSEIEKAEKKLEELDKKPEKKEKAKKKANEKLAGGMTKESCIAFLNELARKEGIERTKKNISSGRADKSGSLKASASLENEADTIENKADSGQTLNKNEQKKVGVNVDKIMTECVKMIKTKKDAEALIRDLVRNLNSLLDDIKSGSIGYEG